jgi:N-glycosylase/DNA lyase
VPPCVLLAQIVTQGQTLVNTVMKVNSTHGERFLVQLSEYQRQKKHTGVQNMIDLILNSTSGMVQSVSEKIIVIRLAKKFLDVMTFHHYVIQILQLGLILSQFNPLHTKRPLSQRFIFLYHSIYA